MALQAAADELYALPPEQFTAARDDFALRLRQAGERDLATAVRGLRRPSVSAWLVNVLVRRRRDEFDELLEIGGHLRDAMASGVGSDVRRLTDDRRTAIAALTADLDALAGRQVPTAASDEVRLTLEAATADPTAATAVQSGRLVRPLRYAGFGELTDVADAVGLAADPVAERSSRRVQRTTARGASTARGQSTAAAVREAERGALEAAGRADDAQRNYEQRLAEQAVAADAVEQAESAVLALHRQLAEADEGLGAARNTERAAKAETEAARRTASEAHKTAEVARRRLASTRAPQRNAPPPNVTRGGLKSPN